MTTYKNENHNLAERKTSQPHNYEMGGQFPIKCSHIEFPCTGIEKHFSQCKYFVNLFCTKYHFICIKPILRAFHALWGDFEDDTFDNTRPVERINMFNYKYYLHKLWERL